MTMNIDDDVTVTKSQLVLKNKFPTKRLSQIFQTVTLTD